MRSKISLCALLIFLIGTLQGCATARSKKSDGRAPCDSSALKFVHRPSRLKVINGCATIRGVVAKQLLSLNPFDGDYHVNVRPDKEFEYVLNAVNRKKKRGAIVLEFSCQGWIQIQKNAREACVGYANRLPIPKLGDYVEISGVLVEDTDSGWNEIHPVVRITVLKPASKHWWHGN